MNTDERRVKKALIEMIQTKKNGEFRPTKEHIHVSQVWGKRLLSMSTEEILKNLRTFRKQLSPEEVSAWKWLILSSTGKCYIKIARKIIPILEKEEEE